MTTQTELLREALERLLTWPLPWGTVEQTLPGWLARECRDALAQPEQPAPQGWPCEIEQADFEADTVTVKMLTQDYRVSAGKHWLSASPTPPQAEQAEAALMANRADEEMRRAEHYKERASKAEEQLAAMQAEAAKPAPLAQQIKESVLLPHLVPGRVAVKPDAERAELSAEAFADLIPLGAVVMADANGPRGVMMTYPQLRQFAAALLSAESKDAGEPVPLENSQEAFDAIDAMLAAYHYPANPKNAARAGWKACRFYLRPQAADAGEPVAADCDVRKIMLAVVPGWDGMGQEVYAKSVREVEDLLSDMGQRLEDFELGITRPQAADAQPLTDKQIRDEFNDQLRAMNEKDGTVLQPPGFAQGVKFAERAHGITGKDNAS